VKDDGVAAPAGEPEVGETLAHFRVVSKLGRGGMGVVFAAEDTKLRRTVALKVLPRQDDESRRQRFLREARAAAAVTHPNIAAVYEVGESGGRPFIAMEYVRGKSLRARLEEGPIGPAEALRLAREIARGVAAAHGAGIVHRDLKPDNVMLADDGSVKVLDFGLAKTGGSGPVDEEQETASASLSVAGQVLGTPSYMSPEQAKGGQVDARSDVFSLGVLVYELATGKRPFAGKTTVEVLIAIDRDTPEPPRRVDPRVPPLLERVVLRCLEKSPAARFADAGQLQRALEVEPVAEPAAEVRRGRRPLALLAVGAAAAAVTAAVALHTSSSRPVPASPSSAAGGGPGTGGSATVSATAMNALPPPTSSNPEAVAAFQAGMQALRDEMQMEAVASWQHAVELDPLLAAAYLRLGIFKRWFQSADEGRKAYSEAVKLRARLSERDLVLLDAVEPCVAREPYDLDEAERRLLAAIARYPGDVEFYFCLSAVYADEGAIDKVGPLQKRFAELDPSSATAASAMALTRQYLGDDRGAREGLDRCRQVAPTRAGCVSYGERILDSQGACADLEAMARGWIAASPGEPNAHRLLARVLLYRGSPIEAVLDAYQQAGSALPDVDDGVEIDLFRGDFPAAEAKLEKSKTAQASPRTLWLLRNLYLETGRPLRARAVADEFLRRSVAWPPFRAGDDLALFVDYKGMMLETQLRTGELTPADFAARRGAWVQGVEARTTGFYRTMSWVPEYADLVRTAGEAGVALDELARRDKLAPWFWFDRAWGAVGRVYELAGRHADALPYLRRATSLCLHDDPEDRLFLGMALEATGDAETACAAYAEVVARWGGAKPRSLTAESARRHEQALRCPLR
jgi:eukaryotic-like serine/threonine-protein kinase